MKTIYHEVITIKQYAAFDQHMLLTQSYTYLPSHAIDTVWLNGECIGCLHILSTLVAVAKFMPIKNITKHVRSYSLY